jgi:hypothetical protein
MAEGFAFMPEALESNAAGQLTDAQIAMFKRGSWMMRWLPAVTGDLRHRRVNAIEGPIRKTTLTDLAQSTTGTGTPRHYLEVAGKSFDVPSTTVWQSAPDVGYVRLYFLPHSHTAVNLERLPDPPVASTQQAVRESVKEVMASALRPAVTTRGLAKKAEDAAQADAVLRAATGGQQVPAPGAESGAPLGEDLVGSWSSPFFNVQVRADGSLTLHGTAQPVGQEGTWRLDPEGRLRVRFDGDPESDEMVTQIAVTADALSLDGQPFTLHRSQ